MTTHGLRLRASTHGTDPSDLERAHAILSHRAARTSAFAPANKLFRDPAWDILLTLFIAQEEAVSLSLREIGEAVHLTEDSTQRWLLALEQTGMVDGADDSRPAELTPAAHAMMRRFLDEV